MGLATRERLRQGLSAQLYGERILLAQLAARLASGCGYPISLVPAEDGTLVFLTLGLPTGAISLGLPPESVRLACAGHEPSPTRRQTMRQRADAIAAFLDASA